MKIVITTSTNTITIKPPQPTETKYCYHAYGDLTLNATGYIKTTSISPISIIVIISTGTTINSTPITPAVTSFSIKNHCITITTT